MEECPSQWKSAITTNILPNFGRVRLKVSCAQNYILSGFTLLRVTKYLLFFYQMQIPDFELKTVGNNAEVDMHESFRTPLFIRDLQHLLLYALMGTKAPIEPSR